MKLSHEQRQELLRQVKVVANEVKSGDMMFQGMLKAMRAVGIDKGDMEWMIEEFYAYRDFQKEYKEYKKWRKESKKN